MGGFLYFIPARTADSLIADGLLKLGDVSEHLLHALNDVRKASTGPMPDADASIAEVHMNGPSGNSGSIIAPFGKHTGQASIITNAPGKQDWYAADGGKYYIGWVKGECPGPLDLERTKTIPGSKIPDALNREWVVPIARSPFGAHGTLPKSFTFEGGKPVGHVRNESRWIWELAGMVNDQLAADSADFEWLVEQVPTILGINYRVGPNELNAMHQANRGVVTEEFVWRVAAGLIHGSIVREAEQKKTDGE